MKGPKVGAILLALWLIVGFVASAQRHYFSGEPSCTKAGTIAITVLAGPLNYVGVNPKVHCKAPQPSS